MKIVVTGGAGFIGSELVKQLTIKGHTVVPFDINGQIRRDVCNDRDLKEMFEWFKPDIVFHAAANKYVPDCDEEPLDAVNVNCLGTYLVTAINELTDADAQIVLISTDKAINPTSVMGATKLIAERMVLNSGGIVVRFGNVKWSTGSVMPIFKEQVLNGGPVTVTHPEMERYFMSVEEAVGLTIRASEIGEPGDIFALDMGKPVRILDLAQEIIGDMDIEVVFTGIRKGEKLQEENPIIGMECVEGKLYVKKAG